MEDRLKNSQFCSAIILAAGKSSRMGSPKFELKFNDEHTFLEEIVFQYKKFGCREIVVVLNEEGIVILEEKQLRISGDAVIVTNNHPEWERFYSIKLGIENLKKQYPVFIHNVDNPFVNQHVLNALHQNHEKADYIMPEFKGRGGHPILASENIIFAIKKESKNNLIFSDFLKQFEKLKVKVNEEKILVNINSKDAYYKFQNEIKI